MSLCTIVKNEEDWIGWAVKGVRSIVSEVIIADTGSSEDSLSLLQKMHDLLQKGNVSAPPRVLKALEQTPFLRTKVEAAKGQLSTWM